MAAVQEKPEEMILSRPATAAELGDPIAYFKRLFDDEGWSTSEVAREVGYDASVVSKVFGGKYEGNLDAVRDSFGEGMRRLLGSSDGADVLTLTSRLIHDALWQSHGSEWMTVIYGPAGIGKTHTLRRYVRKCQRARSRRKALLFTIDQQANTRTLMLEVAAALKVPTRGETAIIIREIVEALKREPHLLIFDECNNLVLNPRRAAGLLNTLRQINDLATCGVALVGTTSIYRVMTDPRNKDLMEMILSRVGLEVEAFPPRPHEVRALLTAHFGEVSDAAWAAFEAGLPDGQLSLRRTAVFVRSAKGFLELKKRPENTPLTPDLARAAWRRISKER